MNSLIDYLGFILLRAFTVFLTLMPPAVALWVGKVIGVIGYYIDVNHRNIAYDNLKTAFATEKTPQELKLITKLLYQNFSQNIAELLRLPAVTPEYLRKHIAIEGEEYLKNALQEKKGLIFLAVHFGSWEVSNVLGTLFGYRYNVIAKEQKRFRRLDKLLTSYRQITGAFVVNRGRGTRDIIESLQRSEVVGMVADQGGKNGVFVDFFGKQASMSAGAIRIAIKLGVNVLPVFLIRKKGPYHVLKINPPLDLKTIPDFEENVMTNLKRVIKDAEEVIRRYPEQYSWFYKVWKYSQERNIIILSDGKAGHLRQSEAVAGILEQQLKQKNITARIRTVEIKFKNNLAKLGLALSGLVSKDYLCHGCLTCLKYFLDNDSCAKFYQAKADFVISCGSGLAGLNLILSRETRAKSICILKPGIIGVKKFDLVIMPKHDKPPFKKNVFVTLGSPNLINELYLSEKKSALLQKFPQLASGKLKMGILIGGNTKENIFDPETLEGFLGVIKEKAKALDIDILLTTSRRTPAQLEELIKAKLSNFIQCKLLIIANEKNIPEAVGGILGLSKISIVSEDSISMISETATCGNSVMVLRFKKDTRLDVANRHDRFLKELQDKGHIVLTAASEVSEKIEDLLKGKIQTNPLNDRQVIVEAVNSII